MCRNAGPHSEEILRMALFHTGSIHMPIALYQSSSP